MKLFTKQIDEKLFNQYKFGNDLVKQVVVAKIFNPYGRGVWYLLNSDPNDPDYIWAIVDILEVEVGSVSRSELESVKVPPFRLPLERDTSFTPISAAILYKQLVLKKEDELTGESEGERRAGMDEYAEGGEIESSENKEMLENQVNTILHHSKELSEVVRKTKEVEPWIITKIQRASTDMADVTHYLEGEIKEKYALGGMMGKGGEFNYGRSWTMDRKGYNKKESYEIPLGDRMDDGGMMEDDGEMGIDKHRIYFSNFADVMDAIHDIAEDNGYEVVNIFPDLSYGGVSYGQTRRASVELVWNGKEKRGKSKKREKNTLNVQIYRMDSGNYELNTYFSYGLGGMMAHGGEIKDVNELEGHYVKVYLLGVKEPIISTIEKATIDDPKYRHRYVRLELLDGAVETIPLNKFDEFLNGHKVELRDGKEPYMLQLVKSKASGGKMADGGATKRKTKKEKEQESINRRMRKRYYVKIYHGGEMPDEVKIFENLADARNAARSGEHSTILDLLTNEEVFAYGGKMAKGGATFADKVSAIKSRLKGTKVPARLKKDYGKRYNAEEAEMAAKRIAGSMRKKEM